MFRRNEVVAIYDAQALHCLIWRSAAGWLRHAE
jgi:hypothetical protein